MDGQPPQEQVNKATVERFWAALERKDFPAAAAELHDDFVEDYAQSGERIVGRENFLGMVSHYPGFPSISVRRHVGRGDLWVTEAAFDYYKDGSPVWQVCEVQEVRDGKIWRIHGFFGAPFEPAEWRAPFVQKIE